MSPDLAKDFLDILEKVALALPHIIWLTKLRQTWEAMATAKNACKREGVAMETKMDSEIRKKEVLPTLAKVAGLLGVGVNIRALAIRPVVNIHLGR